MVYQDFIDRSIEPLQRFSPDVPQFTKTSPRNSPEVGSSLIEVKNAPTLKLPGFLINLRIRDACGTTVHTSFFGNSGCVPSIRDSNDGVLHSYFQIANG